MADKPKPDPLPLPAEGGSYIRDAKGKLVPAPTSVGEPNPVKED